MKQAANAGGRPAADDPRWATPAVVVHDTAQAAAALRLAGPRGVLLLSARGAADLLGHPWFLAMVRAAEAAAGAGQAVAALDCADAPGHALAALRGGAPLLILDGDCPAWPAVAAACRVAGATLWPARPAPALDLRGLDLRRPGGRAKLAAWLAGDG